MCMYILHTYTHIYTSTHTHTHTHTHSQGISYSHSTSADPDADFTAVVELPEGIHEYKYIVDGEWQHDPDKASTCRIKLENR